MLKRRDRDHLHDSGNFPSTSTFHVFSCCSDQNLFDNIRCQTVSIKGVSTSYGLQQILHNLLRRREVLEEINIIFCKKYILLDLAYSFQGINRGS